MNMKYRVLVIDDNRSIHEDFKKILAPEDAGSDELDALGADLFEEEAEVAVQFGAEFEIDTASQGRDGMEMAKKAMEEGNPYALAFVDMRMPPGWDGLETIHAIWQFEAEIHTVICTAHSDHSWHDITEKLGTNDRLLVIKKPFDAVEVIQCAHAMCEKWRLQRSLKERMDQLEVDVAQRTAHLVEAKEHLEKEIEERARMEIELRHAQKLESVGQLAAGVAHEINTPIQFIGDSVNFLKEGFEDAMNLIATYQGAMNDWEHGKPHSELKGKLDEAVEDADIEYVQENAPPAFDRTLEGVRRVAKIVRAMKEFAHPDTGGQQPANLNQAIETTLEVARSEYKLVADVETDLGELPDVTCQLGDINQVVLNLVVNATHAIADNQKDGERGRIRVATRLLNPETVEIQVEDSGGGIPEHVRGKIFDPFFTTKEVGRGTGQGLAISHSVVVEKHQGSLRFDTEVGKGTTFFIQLPVAGVFADASGGEAGVEVA